MNKNNFKLYSLILCLSMIAILFLIWLIYIRTGITIQTQSPSVLPLFNAIMNTAASIAIITGLLAIKSGNKMRHGVAMACATCFSTLFFIGYSVHHYLSGDSHFLGSGVIKITYLFILISHIALSIIAVPLILTTLAFAISRQFELHKKIARITYPIWLYVSVSGVAIYLFLKLSGSI